MNLESKIDRFLKTNLKRRKLTAREANMRKRHTRLSKWPDVYVLYLEIDGQSFQIGSFHTLKRRAEWTRDMLSIALARIK